MDIIEINYSTAIQKAKCLEDIAEEIRKSYSTDMEKAISCLQNGWKGEAACSYITKIEKINTKAIKIADELQKVAETIRVIAKNTYDAEKRALSLII